MQTRISVGELMRCGEAALQTGPFGTQLKADEYVDEGVPVINVRNVGFGDVRDDDLEFVTEAKAEQLHHHRLLRHDIVFGRKGAVERHGLITGAQEGWVQGSDCLRLRLRSERVDVRYLSYYLRTKAHGDWMHALCSFGATMASLNQDIVSRITFPAPKIEVQRKIAAILSAYDDLIANNQRRIALLEGTAEEIYREWFVRRRVPVRVDEGGTGWVEKRFASLCEFRKGRTPDEISVDAAEGLSPYLSVDVLDGNDVGGWVNARKNDVLAAADDVVMLMDGARSGVVFRGAAGVVGSTAALIATAPINRPMVFEYLKAMREVIVWNNTGSAIPHANKDFINRMVLRVPLGEQVLTSFNRLYEPLFEQVQRLRQTNVSLRRTRDALLPRLISGKLKVDHLDIRLPPSMRAEAEPVA